MTPEQTTLVQESFAKVAPIGERSCRAAPRSFELLHVAASILRCAVHPVEFRLGRILRGRAGVDLRGQRDRRRGEDQRGNECLEHDRVSVGCLASELVTSPLVSRTTRHSDLTECELSHVPYPFRRGVVLPHSGAWARYSWSAAPHPAPVA